MSSGRWPSPPVLSWLKSSDPHAHPPLGATTQPNPPWIPPVLTQSLGGFEGHAGPGERGKSWCSVSVTREDAKIRWLQLI